MIFAGGVAVGVGLDRSVWHGGRGFGGSSGGRGDRGSNGPGHDGGRDGRDGGRGESRPPAEMFVRELDGALALSKDQEKQITDLINSRQPQMRALQDEASKRFAAEQQALHDLIVKVLTPEQAKKFDEMPRGPFGYRYRGGRGGPGR
jgi:hypothetical protein